MDIVCRALKLWRLLLCFILTALIIWRGIIFWPRRSCCLRILIFVCIRSICIRIIRIRSIRIRTVAHIGLLLHSGIAVHKIIWIFICLINHFNAVLITISICCAGLAGTNLEVRTAGKCLFVDRNDRSWYHNLLEICVVRNRTFPNACRRLLYHDIFHTPHAGHCLSGNGGNLRRNLHIFGILKIPERVSINVLYRFGHHIVLAFARWEHLIQHCHISIIYCTIIISKVLIVLINSDFCKTVTVGKHTWTPCTHMCANLDGGECRTALKSARSPLLNWCRQNHALERCTVFKCIVLYCQDCFGNFYACNAKSLYDVRENRIAALLPYGGGDICICKRWRAALFKTCGYL